MKTITAADHRDFKSIRAWVEHYLEKIDSDTTVAFQDVSHINVRVYVSSLAKRSDVKLKTKSVKAGIMVWLASGSGPHEIRHRYEDENSRLVAVYEQRLGGRTVRPYELEAHSEFCVRIVSGLKRGYSVTFKGGKPSSLRQRIYNLGYDTGVVYKTKIKGTDVVVMNARPRA